jgi:C1A family cysteine protease
MRTFLNRLQLNRHVPFGSNPARSAAFLLLLALLTVSAYGQPDRSARRATGLLAPTQTEREWMERNMDVVQGVKLNNLAIQRINAQRRSQGLPPIDPEAVPFGEEVVSSQSVRKSIPSPVNAAGLPASVDNSKLPSFPPIRSQEEIGSCASFSTTYYTATHMLGQARGWNNKNDDNATKLSPKWTYPQVNRGQDNGSWFTPTFDVLLKHGAATWSEFPYEGSNTPKSYLEWSRDPAVWRKAIAYRFDRSGQVQNLHTTPGLNDLKTLLANGYALLFATDIGGWNYLPIQDDPSTSADNEFVGRKACAFVGVDPGGHAMTVVGYNDHLWLDLNKNGKVDAGEKGALRIANSWGDDWVPGDVGSDDGGFAWFSYDALKPVSAVAGVDNSGRLQPVGDQSWRGAFWYDSAYYITARAAYTPKLLAQFTISHKLRDQLTVQLGRSPTSETKPRETWQPGALQKQGGGFAFDGAANEVNGTFVMDLSELSTTAASRYYLSVTDGSATGGGTISDFRLTDAAGNTLATAQQGIPGTANNSIALAYVDYGLTSLTVTSKATADGTVGLPFSFTVTSSATPATFGAVGLPRGLAINSSTGVISGTPMETGTFTVSLSVSNPSGSGSGVLILKLDHPPTEPPTITSNTQASGTAGVSFNYSITATVSPTLYGAEDLPSGLTLNSATGVISGIPTAIGTFTVSLSAANVGGRRTRALTITINPPPATVPVITSAKTASVGADSPFSYRITANNNPTSFGAVGLPSGLSLNPADGSITGIPSLARQYVIEISARNTAGTGYEQFILTVTGDSSFGPANDNFANRSTIAGAAAVTGGNNNATAESGEPVHTHLAPYRSVWWTWVAPGNGTATVSTEGSDFNTILAVYTGTAINALKQIANDSDSGSNLTSRLSFAMQAGTAYQIAVDSVAQTGNIVLSVQFQAAATTVANDNFESAFILTATNDFATGRNFTASAQPGEPNHAGALASRSVWWSWTAPASGEATVSTEGSDFDTVLAVYTSSNPPRLGGLSGIANADEGGSNGASVATFSAVQGTTYYIAVDGYRGKTGNIQLGLQLNSALFPANDDFAAAIVLSGSNVTTAGSNNNASYEWGEPYHADEEPGLSLWWTWTAPASGPITIDTTDSAIDTILAVYTGSSLRQLTEVKSNDDAGGLTTSRVRFSAVSGTTYRIAVDGWNEGAITLHLQLQTTAPANDSFAGSAPLIGSTPVAAGNNSNATGQTGEPLGEEAPADKSVWWAWTAPASGLMMFTTAGSDFDTVAVIYTGPNLTNLTYVASNDDDGELFTSRVTFWAVAGSLYHIAVDGYDGASGQIELSSEFADPGEALFATDFDTFPLGDNELVDADGWQGENTNDEVQGIYEAFDEMGGSAFLGYGEPDDSYTAIYRTLNFDPVSQNRPIVNMSVDFSITDSSNDEFDIFAFTLYNRAGESLASLSLDNSDLSIWYENGTNSFRDSGQTFENDTLYTLNLRFDFAANRWTAHLDDVPLFRDQPINVDGRIRDAGDFALEWYLTDPNAPGDNFITFDNVLITATGGPRPPAITAQPQSRVVQEGATITLSAAATGTLPLLYQWRFNGQPLPGATNSTLILLDLKSSGTGSYTMIVSNQVGSVTSAPALISLAANVSPVVSLISPTPGASFTAPALIEFGAAASDNDGTVSKVEFYQGATKLGEVVEAPYTFAWTNVSAGTYQLHARAIDNAGATVDSSPVTVVVNPPVLGSAIRFGPLTLNGGILQIGFTASPGDYIIQRSSDLVVWSDFRTVTVTAPGTAVVQDTIAPAQGSRAFYRVKRP